MPRHQLPTYSPLTAAGIIRALRTRGHHAGERLTRRLGERYGADTSILCGSGTEALTLALRGAGDGQGRPLVALPAYACYDLVSAAVGADSRIVFYDVRPSDLAPDPDSLAQVCGAGPDAVVVAPLFGVPVDWDRVRELVTPCGALLVEDAAQGLGAEWRGQRVGSLGDVSVLSFGRGKGWTGGTGGALLVRTENARITAVDRHFGSSLGVVARAAAQWLIGRPETYWIPAGMPWLALGETIYHPPSDPSGMPEAAAAIVLAHEKLAWAEVATRRENAAALLGHLQEVGPTRFSTVSPPDEGTPGYLRLPLLTPEGMQTFADQGRARAAGIMPGYPRPLPSLPEASERAERGPSTPGATQLANQVVTLPTHSLGNHRDLRRLFSLLDSPPPG